MVCRSDLQIQIINPAKHFSEGAHHVGVVHVCRQERLQPVFRDRSIGVAAAQHFDGHCFAVPFSCRQTLQISASQG